jgi:hypothetical protein
MAVRLHKLHQEDIRQKIQASNLVARLQMHVDGEVEMTATQVRAAEALLDRSIPKLSQIQHTGRDGGPIEISWPLPKTKLDEA